MKILGIETSCDETGIAIYDSEQGLIAHNLYSQIETHRKFGGVVPELASRDHIRYLIPVLDKTLKDAKLTKQELNGIAYTAGPGLVGALLTGACFAKSLSFALNIPAIKVHHLEAHMLAAKLDNPLLEFPFTVLLVSGGHTQLLYAKSFGNYKLLGDTLDDAVGEAFDKTAKLMGIPYPGGPEIAALADKLQQSSLPDFPRPMVNRPNLDFSFSGLKTHALIAWNKSNKDEKATADIAKAFQDAVVDTLTKKCKKALQVVENKSLVVAGGVGANRALRASLKALMLEINGEVCFPRIEYCTDNGAMVAYAGYLRMLNQQIDSNLGIEVKARWAL